MTRQQVANKLQEKFFDSRSAMQNDYGNRAIHYTQSQKLQTALDLINAGKDAEAVKFIKDNNLI